MPWELRWRGFTVCSRETIHCWPFVGSIDTQFLARPVYRCSIPLPLARFETSADSPVPVGAVCNRAIGVNLRKMDVFFTTRRGFSGGIPSGSSIKCAVNICSSVSPAGRHLCSMRDPQRSKPQRGGICRPPATKYPEKSLN